MHQFLEQARIRLSPRAWEVRFRLLRERLEGVDFSTTLQPEDVGLDPATANRCSPSGNRFLRHVLQSLNLSSADRIVDIGCGKGSAMRVMLEFPFEKVDGVELSDAIASVARKNFARLKVPETRCTIYATDATQFSQIDDYNFVYLYNPFPCAVMALFMQSLARSIERAPRSLTFIYNNAVCHNEVIAGNLFHKQSEYPDEWGNKIAVYTNRKP